MSRRMLRVGIAILAAFSSGITFAGADGAAGAHPAYRYVEADTFGSPHKDFALSLATGRRTLVVGGYVSGPLPGQTHYGQTDAVIRVYSRDFRERWTRQIGTEGNDGTAVVATDGWVIVAGGWTAGDLGGPSHGHDQSGWVKAFRRDGTERWSHRFGSAVTGIAVTPDAVYVGGRAEGYGQVKAYTHNGRQLWVTQMRSYQTPAITHLAAADDRVFYGTGHTPIDSLPESHLGSLDARTGESDWYTLHSTDGDSITALSAAGDRVYVSSTGRNGVTAYRTSDGFERWSSDDVKLPQGERMRFATAIAPGEETIVAIFIGYDTTALATLSPRGRILHAQRLRQVLPTGVVRRQGSAYVSGYTRADLDGPAAGGWDGVVARYTIEERP